MDPSADTLSLAGTRDDRQRPPLDPAFLRFLLVHASPQFADELWAHMQHFIVGTARTHAPPS